MTEPRCPYFGSCGGCTYQDIPYPRQLKIKQDQLNRHLDFDSIEIFSGEPFHYRTRMDFVFHAGGLGLRKKGFWDKMVDIENCALSSPRLNELLKEVREFFDDVFYFDVRRRFGTFCYAVIRTPPEDSSVSLVLNRKSKQLQEAVFQIQEFAEITSARNVAATLIPHNRHVSVSEEYFMIKGSPWLEEEYLGKRFVYPVQGFFQVNHAMTEKLLDYCRDIIKAYSGPDVHLYDLYSGAGTFGIINAPYFNHITLAEDYAPAVKASEKNLEHNGISHASAVCVRDKHFPKIEYTSPYAVIMDPPRSGVHPRVIQMLERSSPEVLLYISCNPKLLERDLNEMKSYRIKSAALFDLFPQTPHMEAVVELVKK